MRFEKTAFSCRELIFAICGKSRSIGIITFFIIIGVHAIEIQVKQHAAVKHVNQYYSSIIIKYNSCGRSYSVNLLAA